MLFVSYEFIAFLCLVVIGYYTFFKRFQWQFLLFVSLLFWACSFGNIEEKATYKYDVQKNKENQKKRRQCG